MSLRRVFWLPVVAFTFGVAPSAWAYIDLAPTLATVIREAQAISVVEVDRFSLEKGAVLLKHVGALKGELATDPIKHIVRTSDGTIDQAILEWAEPGRRGVLFASGKSTLVCLGRGWYQVQAAADGWSQVGAARPDLSLSYYGHVSRLNAAIVTMLAEKTAIITVPPHNMDDQSDFDLPLNRASLPGLVTVQRLRANMRMPGMVMAVATNAAYVIGPGAAGEDEIPALIAGLEGNDPLTRAESAMDLGTLGRKSAAAVVPLEKLLADPIAETRMAAAAALLRIRGQHADAVKALASGLNSTEGATQRAAARAAGLGGAGAASLATKLGELLAVDDRRTRSAALQAIATLGTAASEAYEPVLALLDKPEMTIDAADALGRIGPAARPALKKLAKLLEATSTTQRWAAVRAMAQIGGPDAKPAVDFMVRELKNPSIVDGYNMMIYFALLGPVAKDALPAIQSSRMRVNPFLRPATLWAINPEQGLPWQIGGGGFGPPGGPPGGMGPGGPGGGNDFAGVIFESYVRELGDQIQSTAVKLAEKIMDGTAGEVPKYGYKILIRFPERALPILTAGLSDKELMQRERAAVALGYMGSAAAPAKPQVAAAIANAPGERELRLLKWCLREISAE